MLSAILKKSALPALAGLGLFWASPLAAASCCGGGSGGALLLPKFASNMLAFAAAAEKYNGYWNEIGRYLPDPPGSDLRQYRVNLGFGHRLGSRWQTSISLPLVLNQNYYSGLRSLTYGPGDTSLNLTYEAFDDIKCVYKVRNLADLTPAIYFGANLLLPTGISPYDQVKNSFDISGRGFYRLDASILIDKTVYPLNFSVQASYGKHLQRPVNREYGSYVLPYNKLLGDRWSATASLGYTVFFPEMQTLTMTAAFSWLSEGHALINGQSDPTSGFSKNSISLALAWANAERSQIYKLAWAQNITLDLWGQNYPATMTLSLEASHVFF